MGDFIYFTEEQKERANAVPIMDILKREHEEVERSGNEWRWKRHGSVTFRGNRWYRHSQQVGSHAIDFMQEFFGMSYPEAVTYLLDGETVETESDFIFWGSKITADGDCSHEIKDTYSLEGKL